MSNTVLLFVLIAIVFGLAPSAFGGLRNARGVFIAYFVGGVLVPAVTAFAVGEGAKGDVFDIVSPLGVKAVILCTIALIITVAVSMARERAAAAPVIQTIYPRNERLARLFAWLSIMLTVLYLGAMSWRLGGIVEMTYRLYQRVSLLDSIANFLSVFSFGSFVFAICAVSFARGSRGYTFWLALASAVIFLGQSLLLGGRSIVVLFFVAVFYTAVIRMKAGRAALFSSVGLVLIGVISYLMANLRFFAQSEGRQVANGDVTETAMTGLTWIDHIAASISYAQDRGHDFGQLYINTLFLPIPRDMWPDKPLQISVYMREYLFGDITGGNPPGLFGEAYIAFGSIGMFAAAVLLGQLIGQINVVTNVAIRFDCRLRNAIAGILAPLYGFALVRGGIDIGMMRIGIPALWCGLAYLIVRNRGITINVPAFEARRRQLRAAKIAARKQADRPLREAPVAGA